VQEAVLERAEFAGLLLLQSQIGNIAVPDGGDSYLFGKNGDREIDGLYLSKTDLRIGQSGQVEFK
jgi:hypothetical protein